MPIVVTMRNLGTAAIVAGLLMTLFTLAGVDSDRPFVLAGLIVLVGIGLRIEAAMRAVVTRTDSGSHP